MTDKPDERLSDAEIEQWISVINHEPARNTLRELLARRSAHAGVGVKAVKWQFYPALGKTPDHWFAHDDLGGTMTATFDANFELPWVARPFPAHSNYATADEAKAALEAAREARIRSALEPEKAE